MEIYAEIFSKVTEHAQTPCSRAWFETAGRKLLSVIAANAQAPYCDEEPPTEQGVMNAMAFLLKVGDTCPNAILPLVHVDMDGNICLTWTDKSNLIRLFVIATASSLSVQMLEALQVAKVLSEEQAVVEIHRLLAA